MINTLEGCKKLLQIEGRPELNETDKALIRNIWKNGVTNPAKVHYNDYFQALDLEEQRSIKEFWGFDSHP